MKLVSEILVTGPAGERRLFISPDNIFLLAAVPAFITGFLTRGFFSTVAVGMAAVALARFLMQ